MSTTLSLRKPQPTIPPVGEAANPKPSEGRKSSKEVGNGEDPTAIPIPAPVVVVADEEFWFVWNIYRHRPRVRHPTLEAAVVERARLQEVTPDCIFWIFHATRVEP